MFRFDFLYIIINLILLLVFYYAGRNASIKRDYWSYSIFCVVFFTIVLGLRYGRGNDYFHYVDLYVYGYNEGRQIVFAWINSSLKWLGVGKHYIFVFYAFIEMVCAMFFLKRYRKYALFMFPLFLISNIFFDEYQIRQALGFSFVYLCLDRLFNIKDIRGILDGRCFKDVVFGLLYFIIAYSIHSACGYMLVIMIAIYFLYRRTIPLKYSIPALLFCTYFFSEWFDFGWLNPILNQFVGEDARMSHYLEDSDKWFSAKGANDIYTRNPIVLAAEMLGTISLFTLGSKSINKYCKSADAYAMYNFFVIGSLIINAFRKLELLHRIGYDFALFWFFSLSIVLYYGLKKNNINVSGQAKIISLTSGKTFLFRNWNKLFAIFLFWFAYDYLKYLFMRGSMTKFIWDI